MRKIKLLKQISTIVFMWILLVETSSLLGQENKKWDILYLGCGWTCGTHNISKEKTKKNKYLTQYNQFYKDERWFTKDKNDLRSICSIKKCKPITEHISQTYQP